VGPGIGVGDPARELLDPKRRIAPGIEGENVVALPGDCIAQVTEQRRGFVAALGFANTEVQGATVETSGGSRLETLHGKAKFPQIVAEGRGGITHSTALLILKTDMEETPHKGARRDDDGLCAEGETETGSDSCDAITLDLKSGDVALVQVQVGRPLQNPLHAELIRLLVALSPRRPDAGTLGGIEHPELNRGRIGIESHRTTQGIDLPDHMPFGETADGWVAAHLADGVEVLGNDGGGAALTGPKPEPLRSRHVRLR